MRGSCEIGLQYSVQNNKASSASKINPSLSSSVSSHISHSDQTKTLIIAEHPDVQTILRDNTVNHLIMAPTPEADGDTGDLQTLLTMISCCDEVIFNSKLLGEAFGIARPANA